MSTYKKQSNSQFRRQMSVREFLQSQSLRLQASQNEKSPRSTAVHSASSNASPASHVQHELNCHSHRSIVQYFTARELRLHPPPTQENHLVKSINGFGYEYKYKKPSDRPLGYPVPSAIPDTVDRTTTIVLHKPQSKISVWAADIQRDYKNTVGFVAAAFYVLLDVLYLFKAFGEQIGRILPYILRSPVSWPIIALYIHRPSIVYGLRVWGIFLQTCAYGMELASVTPYYMQLLAEYIQTMAISSVKEPWMTYDLRYIFYIAFAMKDY